MNILYKKSLLKTAIAALLLTFTSSQSFAYTDSSYESIAESEYHNDYSYDGTDSQEEKSDNFYMSFNYNKVISSMGSFSAREDALGIKTEKSSSKYTDGLAGNASIGYRTGNFRVELEGLASSATTDNKNIELENPRSSMINFGDLNKDEHFIRVFIKDTNDEGILLKEFQATEEYENFTKNLKIQNEGFQNKAAMINAYYDINNNSDFIPYFGIGGGLTNVKFFGVSKIKPAVQGKLGLNYSISDKIQLSAGYRYFVALGDTSFSGIKLDKEIPTLKYKVIKRDVGVAKEVSIPGATTAIVESKFANHALEVGLTFNF